MYSVHCTAEVHERLGGYERRVEGGWPGGAGDGVSAPEKRRVSRRESAAAATPGYSDEDRDCNNKHGDVTTNRNFYSHHKYFVTCDTIFGTLLCT